ncbi:glycosyl hydrolase [Parafrankia sp. FMc2]|uniref:glycosyl hydrolase n=1 Tax=Parafrankia sp. FMc2 TaxID=3233196 RepID=UPI0034D6DC05
MPSDERYGHGARPLSRPRRGGEAETGGPDAPGAAFDPEMLSARGRPTRRRGRTAPLAPYPDRPENFDDADRGDAGGRGEPGRRDDAGRRPGADRHPADRRPGEDRRFGDGGHRVADPLGEAGEPDAADRRAARGRPDGRGRDRDRGSAADRSQPSGRARERGRGTSRDAGRPAAGDLATQHFRRSDWDGAPRDGRGGARPRENADAHSDGRVGADQTMVMPPVRPKPPEAGPGPALRDNPGRRDDGSRAAATGRSSRDRGAVTDRPGRDRDRADRDRADRDRADRDRADRDRAGRDRTGEAGGAGRGARGHAAVASSGSVTGILPMAGDERDHGGRGRVAGAAGGGNRPGDDRSVTHRATDWIIEHWGAKPGRHPYLPVALVVFAVLLALVAWMLGPAQHEDADLAANSAPVQAPIPSPAVASQVPVTAPAPGPQNQQPMAAPPSARVERAATSGLFPSGVAAHTMAEANAWAEFRGTPVDVVVTYTDRDSWDAIVNPWMGRVFSSFPGDLVISVPMFPDEGPQKGNLVSCAEGDYNARWRQFGRWLVSQGRGDSFVRLGWEFNGGWFAWKASANPTAYKQCFQNASSSIKETSPEVRIDWTINAHGPDYDAFSVYPGNQYVDVIGIDSYDQYPPSPTSREFGEQCNADQGLCQVINFARQNGKLFSVPEWSVVSQQNTQAGMRGAAGGDNPVYIQEMYNVFRRNANILAYEAYFNDDIVGNVRSTLVNPNRHPASSALYQRLW